MESGYDPRVCILGGFGVLSGVADLPGLGAGFAFGVAAVVTLIASIVLPSTAR